MPTASNEERDGRSRSPRSLCLVETQGLPGGQTLCRILSTISRCETRTFDSLAGLRQSLRPNEPALVVIPEPNQGADDLAACVEWLRASGPPSSLLLVVTGSIWPRTQEILADAPRTQLLFGTHRLTARLVEAVLMTLGVHPRIHPRSQTRVAGQLQLDGGAIEPFELIDVSESGARIRCRHKLEIGVPVLLRFALDNRPFEVEAVPMRRTMNGPEGVEIGTQFEQPDETLIETIRKLVHTVKRAEWPFADPLRAKPRVRLAESHRVRVRLNPEGSARQTYLTALNMSLTGVKAQAPAGVDLALAAGARVDLLVSSNGRGFRCRAKVVRVDQERGAEALGLQFEGLSNEARRTLNELLELVGDSQ